MVVANLCTTESRAAREPFGAVALSLPTREKIEAAPEKLS
jgi:hypothetical protein